MGAKQSKRSVDISGKEAEGTGDVAAAGAGGEGRVEQLSDADTLKPQHNGVAHIGDEKTEQKELENGTSENEKDAVTEKEEKQDEEKPETPLTNGESETKVENGESTPAPEDGKKPKKEKVKKKWSLRSISFSRKDKPKQEKKQKDDEPKTNGEQEKVPEEAAEVIPEVAVTAAAEVIKSESEEKEEKTPETPVTEPITNGSTTPESETVLVQEPDTTNSKNEVVENKVQVEPEQLPINGLTLEETVKQTAGIDKHEENKEEPIVELPEVLSEISTKKEVCVEQMSLIDPTPPPLPANPPPSSVVSFAATTMAPESTDALANTADNTLPPPLTSDLVAPKQELPFEPENNVEVSKPNTDDVPSSVIESYSEQPLVVSVQQTEKLSPPVKEVIENVSTQIIIDESIIEKPSDKPENSAPITESVTFNDNTTKLTKAEELSNVEEDTFKEVIADEKPASSLITPEEVPEPSVIDDVPASPVTDELPAPPPIIDDVQTPSPISDETEAEKENSAEILPTPPLPICDDEIDTQQSEYQKDNHLVTDSLKIIDNKEIIQEITTENIDEEQNIKSKDSLGNLIEKVECNGNIESDESAVEHEIIDNKNAIRTTATAEDSSPDSLMLVEPQPDDTSSRSLPASAPQDAILPTNDKLADLIPEIPDVPELKTETVLETTNDVAVSN